MRINSAALLGGDFCSSLPTYFFVLAGALLAEKSAKRFINECPVAGFRRITQTDDEPLPGLPRGVSGGGVASQRRTGESFSQAYLYATRRVLDVHRIGRTVLLAGEREFRRRVL